MVICVGHNWTDGNIFILLLVGLDHFVHRALSLPQRCAALSQFATLTLQVTHRLLSTYATPRHCNVLPISMIQHYSGGLFVFALNHDLRGHKADPSSRHKLQRVNGVRVAKLLFHSTRHPVRISKDAVNVMLGWRTSRGVTGVTTCDKRHALASAD
jgi:hypothetical protein